MNGFLEGVEAITLTCSLVLFAPGIGALLLGRGRRSAHIAAWIVAAWLMAWIRFSRWWTPLPGGWLHVAAGLSLIALAAAAWRTDRTQVDIALVALASALVTWTWVPCVGPELGSILNNAPNEPWQQLLPTLWWLLGIYLPMVVVGALVIAAPGTINYFDRRSVRIVGMSIIAIVGLLVAIRLYDDLASELARRSSY